MKKLVLVSLVVAAVVAFSASNAMATRYFGGTYTILKGDFYGPGWPWGGDTGTGPHAYTAESSNALSDGTVSIAETEQLMSANPAQVAFADPGNNSGPGGSDVWWGATPGNDRFDAFQIDLGKEVQIDAIAAILNVRHSPSQMSLQQLQVNGSHDASTWTRIIHDDTFPYAYAKYANIYVKPANVPIGLFYNPANAGAYDLDTVTYRYLKIAISRGGNPDTMDSTGLSEFIIDEIPEPATILMLVGGGLLGLLRRKS
jgi:hypothetical protein